MSWLSNTLGGLGGGGGGLIGAGLGFMVGGPMGAMAGGMLGSQLGGQAQQSEYMDDALKAQSHAQAQALAAQMFMYQQQRADYMPFRQIGLQNLVDYHHAIREAYFGQAYNRNENPLSSSSGKQYSIAPNSGIGLSGLQPGSGPRRNQSASGVRFSPSSQMSTPLWMV